MSLNISKMFTPPGTGAVKSAANAATSTTNAAARKAEAAWQYGEPIRQMFSAYLTTGNTAGLPSWMHVPDAETTARQVYNAYNALGSRSLSDLYEQQAAALRTENLRRGILNPSPISTGGYADLASRYSSDLARSGADALLKALQTAAALRGEAGENWLNALKFLTNPEGAATDLSLANAYSNIASMAGRSLGGNPLMDVFTIAMGLPKIFPNVYGGL